MKIRNNLIAKGSLRRVQNNRSAVSKSIEKLSTGYRINRASDDASGMTISEKMRSQIKGINQAVENAQDGISLVQTAEGGMQEITGILQRMKSLATKSANGIYDVTTDRKAIQMEVDQLSQELHRIVYETNFNGKYLFSGLGSEGVYDALYDDTKRFDNPFVPINLQIGAKGNETISLDPTMLLLTGVEHLPSSAWTDRPFTWSEYSYSEDSEQYGPLCGLLPEFIYQSNYYESKEDNYLRAYSLYSISKGVCTDSEAFTGYTHGINVGGYGGWDSEEHEWDHINDEPYSFSVAEANKAITNIENSINAISVCRSYLGAIQNRLESTINNQMTISENLQSTESRIRDVDVASEMVEFTKNNILVQSAQAMLSQANALPQSVLQLLTA